MARAGGHSERRRGLRLQDATARRRGVGRRGQGRGGSGGEGEGNQMAAAGASLQSRSSGQQCQSASACSPAPQTPLQPPPTANRALSTPKSGEQGGHSARLRSHQPIRAPHAIGRLIEVHRPCVFESRIDVIPPPNTPAFLATARTVARPARLLHSNVAQVHRQSDTVAQASLSPFRRRFHGMQAK